MRVAARIALGNAVLIGLLTLALFAAIGISSNIYQKAVTQDSLSIAEQITKRIEYNIDFFREDMELFLTAVPVWKSMENGVNASDIRKLLTARFIDYFESRYGYRLYEMAMLTDMKGNVAGCSAKMATPNVSERDWWKQAAKGEIVYSNITRYDTFNTYGMSISIPIRDAAGKFKGVFQTIVSASAIFANSGILSRQASTSIFELVNQENLLLSSSRLFRYLEDLSGKSYIRELGQDKGSLFADVNGRKFFIVQLPFSGNGVGARLGWRLIALNDYNQVFGQGTTLRNWLALATLVIILLASYLAYRLSLSITERLEQLATAAQQLGAGNLHARASSEGDDEIADLGRTFNAMADNLQANTDALTREIEQRQRAEHSLEQQSEKLRKSNQELEQFAYIASHDLQEPLRIIVSYLQLVDRRYSALLDQDGKRFIDAATNGAERMRSLIRGLLQYSRVSTRANPMETVELDAVLDIALENLEQAIADNGAQINRSPLPRICGDELQLVQLFQNLIGNAVKFHKKDVHPEVSIRAEQVAGRKWNILVQDNGIGMDEQYSSKIFALFQRLHSRGEYEGTGIGLAICKRIAERHGGHISFTSTPNEGTTFTVTLFVEE